MSSVQTGLKTIIEGCVRFSACFRTIKNKKKSEHNEDNEVRLATALFNKRLVIYLFEDVEKLFRFLSCWYLLGNQPRFQAASLPTQTTFEVSPKVGETMEDSAESIEEESARKARPDGRRKSKDELVTRQMRAKKMKHAKSAFKLQEMQLAQIKRWNEILLLPNGPGGATTARAQKYFILKQEKVLKAIKKERKGNEENDPSNLIVLVYAVVNTDICSVSSTPIFPTRKTSRYPPP